MAKLILSLENTLLNECELDKERITIGRRPNNDIHIDVESVQKEQKKEQNNVAGDEEDDWSNFNTGNQAAILVPDSDLNDPFSFTSTADTTSTSFAASTSAPTLTIPLTSDTAPILTPVTINTTAATITTTTVTETITTPICDTDADPYHSLIEENNKNNVIPDKPIVDYFDLIASETVIASIDVYGEIGSNDFSKVSVPIEAETSTTNNNSSDDSSTNHEIYDQNIEFNRVEIKMEIDERVEKNDTTQVTMKTEVKIDNKEGEDKNKDKVFEIF